MGRLSRFRKTYYLLEGPHDMWWSITKRKWIKVVSSGYPWFAKGRVHNCARFFTASQARKHFYSLIEQGHWSRLVCYRYDKNSGSYREKKVFVPNEEYLADVRKRLGLI